MERDGLDHNRSCSSRRRNLQVPEGVQYRLNRQRKLVHSFPRRFICNLCSSNCGWYPTDQRGAAHQALPFAERRERPTKHNYPAPALLRVRLVSGKRGRLRHPLLYLHRVTEQRHRLLALLRRQHVLRGSCVLVVGASLFHLLELGYPRETNSAGRTRSLIRRHQ